MAAKLPLFFLMFYLQFSFFGIAQNSDAFISKELGNLAMDTTSTQWMVTAEHVSSTSGTHHIYYQQASEGILLRGTESSLHISAHGTVLSKSNGFARDISAIEKINHEALISPAAAVRFVISELGYQPNYPLEVLQKKNTKNKEVIFSNAGISQRDIPVKLIYTLNEQNDYVLAWEISILELDFEHWWNLQVDALSGKILSRQNRIRQCAFDTGDAPETDFNKNLYDMPNYEANKTVEAANCNDCYEVFAMPVESPYVGLRTIVESPAHPVASPYGWHDVDGQPGPEYTVTHGNNVNAYEGNDNFGFQPSGGPTLNFTGFPFNINFTQYDQYEAASVTNLFYWGNVMHDVYYVYGFDEAAGNFQFNSLGRGGSANDGMRAQAQRNLSGCKAFYGFTGDGESPVMILGTCETKDGSFDSVVIAHEYGHGITSRLVGGPVTLDCLDNDEQMSEGWCDWFGTILTIPEGAEGEDLRFIGNYYFDKGINGNGIRRYPYTTDENRNRHTYNSIKRTPIPHGVGAVWANMLWEMTWALIENNGFDPDVTNFTGDPGQDKGNVMALAIVTEGLKLTPCSPGFVDARDAILLADIAIYGGYNQCYIMDAFAKRGLGIGANQGNGNQKNDGTENYEGYLDHAEIRLNKINFCYSDQIVSNQRGGLPFGGIYSGPGVIDDGNGLSFSLDLAAAGVGIHEVFYEIEESNCAAYSITSETFTIALDVEPPFMDCPTEDLEAIIPEGTLFSLPLYGIIFYSDDNCTEYLEFAQNPPHFTELDVGSYPITVIATDEAGNESQCSFTLRVLRQLSGDDDGGIHNVDLNGLELMKLAPNPTQGLLVLNNPLQANVVSINVFNIDGRFVKSMSLNKNDLEIDFSISDLSTGMYFVNVNLKSASRTFQLVKH